MELGACLDTWREEKTLALPGIEIEFLGRSALVTISAALLRIYFLNMI
jgi:hypothetical protein